VCERTSININLYWDKTLLGHIIIYNSKTFKNDIHNFGIAKSQPVTIQVIFH